MASSSQSADTGSEALPPVAFCDSHKDQEIERYCDTHKCLVCAKCIIDKHTKCQHVTLTNKIGTSNPYAAVIDDTKTVTVLLQRVKLFQACNESDRIALAASTKRCRDDVARLRKKVNLLLDEAGQTLDYFLQSHECLLNTNIDTHVNACKHVIEHLEAQLKQLETCQILDKSTMYIGHAKAQADIEETRKVVQSLETELNQNRLLEFEPSKRVKKCFTELHNLGEIVEQRVNGVRQCVSVGKCNDIAVTTGNIRGCTFLPDGTLFFCNYREDKLFHYTDTFQYRSELKLPSYPNDVAAICDLEVVVTVPSKQQLQFVTTAGGLKLDRTVKLDRECYGIAHSNGKLYVTCRDLGGGRGEVFIIDMSGKVLNRIGRIDRMFKDTKYMFEFPDYVSVSTYGSMIHVSDVSTHTVTCLSEAGQIVYQSKEVASPWGMCVGPGDQLTVCGKSSDKVVLLGDRGQMLCELVTGKDGVGGPQCTTYRPSDSVLVVGMGKGLKVFWLK